MRRVPASKPLPGKWSRCLPRREVPPLAAVVCLGLQVSTVHRSSASTRANVAGDEPEPLGFSRGSVRNGPVARALAWILSRRHSGACARQGGLYPECHTAAKTLGGTVQPVPFPSARRSPAHHRSLRKAGRGGFEAALPTYDPSPQNRRVAPNSYFRPIRVAAFLGWRYATSHRAVITRASPVEVCREVPDVLEILAQTAPTCACQRRRSPCSGLYRLRTSSDCLMASWNQARDPSQYFPRAVHGANDS